MHNPKAGKGGHGKKALVAALKKSAVVEELWKGSMHLLTLLAQAFLPHGLPQQVPEVDEERRRKWDRRFHAALVPRLPSAIIMSSLRDFVWLAALV